MKSTPASAAEPTSGKPAARAGKSVAKVEAAQAKPVKEAKEKPASSRKSVLAQTAPAIPEAATRRSRSRKAMAEAEAVATARKPSARKTPPASTKAAPSPEDLEKMIATAAYFNAIKRGFEAGHEQEDWVAAEQEIKQMLSSS